ncbi:MAG: AMP-binding protein, partial [Paracraurococcus sp.]
PNGPEMAAAFVAIACGATTAPLNPAYKDEEFEFYLTDLKARALVIQQGMDSPARAVAARLGVPVIELVPGAAAGEFTLEGGAPGRAAQAGEAGPDDIALVLHTSGTTARPKIVPL